MNADAKQDLTLRLEQLVGELAPASDRRVGVEKLHAILDRVPAVDETAGADEALALGAELGVVRHDLADARGQADHLQEQLANAAATVTAVRTELDETQHKLEAAAAANTQLQAELETEKTKTAALETELEAATKPATT